MTNEARTARENALTFEAKKDGLSQRQDGSLVVRFKLHPNDETDVIVKAPMGTRYRMVLVELNDDETPKVQARTVTQEPATRAGLPTQSGGTGAKFWRDLSAAQQAGILCGERAFAQFLGGEAQGYFGAEDCAKEVRRRCGVTSRKGILPGSLAEQRWKAIVSDFRAWELAPRVMG